MQISLSWRRLVGAAAMLACLGAIAYASWLLRAEARLAERWGRELLRGLPPSEYYPNQTNLAGEKLAVAAAKLGLNLDIPATSEGGRKPATGDAWGGTGEMLQAYLEAYNTSLSRVPPIPARLVDDLDRRSEGLRAIVQLASEETRPVWGFDLADGALADHPDFLGHLQLVRLLSVAALASLQQGEPVEAGQRLATAAKLTHSLHGFPSLHGTILHQAEFVTVLGVVRRLCDPPTDWPRLTSLELEEKALDGLQLEGWALLQMARQGLYVKPTLLARLLVVHSARATDQAVRQLRRTDPVTFDRESFFQEQVDRIPRWSIVSRSVFPDLHDVWLRGVQAELLAEQTRRVLEYRRGQSGRAELLALDGQPTETIPGLRWRAVDREDGVLLSTSPNFEWRNNRRWPNLEFLVSPTRCAGSGTAPSPAGFESP